MDFSLAEMRSARSVQGFTLIEIMIVVAIISIAAAVAIPSYQNYVENTRRETVKSDLMQLAQRMERQYGENFDYREDGTAPDLPFERSPRESEPGKQFYDISFDGDVERSTYTLQAEPVNAQSDDDCGTLTIDEQGNKGAAEEGCW